MDEHHRDPAVVTGTRSHVCLLLFDVDDAIGATLSRASPIGASIQTERDSIARELSACETVRQPSFGVTQVACYLRNAGAAVRS